MDKCKADLECARHQAAERALEEYGLGASWRDGEWRRQGYGERSRLVCRLYPMLEYPGPPATFNVEFEGDGERVRDYWIG